MDMKYRGRLFRWKDPFAIEETERLFLDAVKENCRFQYRHCGPYREILDHFHFSPEDLKEYKDIEKLPFLPTWVFKNYPLFSMPERKMLIQATSSGTKGKFSRIGKNYSLYYHTRYRDISVCEFYTYIKFTSLRISCGPGIPENC